VRTMSNEKFAEHRKRGESPEEYEERLRLDETLKNIKHTLLVISGKGGVGKTTVAVNLATGLARRGYSVGLLDVDIHGPNIAKMLGLDGERTRPARGNRVTPVPASENLKVISISFFLEKDSDAVIWRGPLKMKVIKQFLSDVEWGALDYLIIDSPPGTGDEPLSVGQLIPHLDGAIIVTTPQEVAVLDARKCATFARQLNVPVIGIIENMSGFTCPHCGKEIDIFKKGGGERAARELALHFLGRLPLDPMLVTSGDEGRPFIEAHEDTETARSINAIIEKTEKRIADK
jgi:ATP-binding protein involved in chromosome partitioning